MKDKTHWIWVNSVNTDKEKVRLLVIFRGYEYDVTVGIGDLNIAFANAKHFIETTKLLGVGADGMAYRGQE